MSCIAEPALDTRRTAAATDDIRKFAILLAALSRASAGGGNLRPQPPAACRSDEGMRDAVELWLTDPTSCIARYGYISKWDVSKVADMSYMELHAIQSSRRRTNRRMPPNCVYLLNICRCFFVLI